MSFKYLDGRKISVNDLILYEKKNNFIFSESFKKFLIKYNDAKVEWNRFKINKVLDGIVSRFLDIKDIVKKKKILGIVATNRFPFALAEGGNYVVIDFRSGKIYFWGHEMPHFEYKIAENIEEFLLSIIPQKIEFDNKPVDPVTVLDPEFYKMVLEQQEKEKNLYEE